MGAARPSTPSDVFVSWLPLYHDMGLIGAWLAGLYYGCPLVVMSPLRSWPGRRVAVGDREHRGTLSASPNFGYELCLRHVGDAEMTGLDLSSLRLVVDGSEPVGASTHPPFHRPVRALRVAPGGDDAGLRACRGGVGLTPPRSAAGRSSTPSTVAPWPAADALCLPRPMTARSSSLCGLPLPGYQLRVVDGAGKELPSAARGKWSSPGRRPPPGTSVTGPPPRRCTATAGLTPATSDTWREANST